MKAFCMPVLAAGLMTSAACAQSASAPVPAPAYLAYPASQPSQPSQRAPASLASAIARAQQHNGDLQSLALEVAALQARSQSAGVRPNPTLDYLREGDRGQGGATTLQVAIPFELGGKRDARMETALAELRMAQASLAVGRMRIQAEVIAAYHDAYLAGQRLALATQTGESARQSSRSAGRRVLAGKISPLEETRAQVAESNLKLEAIQAARDLAEARSRLALLLGSPASELGELSVPDIALPVLPSEEAMAGALAAAPSMARAAADLDWRSASARLERSKRLPDVALILGQKREGIKRERQTVVGLSFPLPLFDRNQGGVLEAERRIDKSRQELASAQLRLQAEAGQAAARLSAALEQERLIREEILPGSQSAFTAASKGFDAGKFGFLDVLDAQRTLFQAHEQHLRASADAHRAAAELAALIGPIPAAHPTSPIQDSK